MMKRLLIIACILSSGSLARAQSAPPLGSAESFAILGATTVTNTGLTVIKGDLGVSPGTAVTGFPPGTVIGGTIHSNDASATSAHADAFTAYNALAAETCGTNLSGSILGTSANAVTLSPGVYCFGSSAQLTGTLTLSGKGVYVFQVGTTLTTASASSVVLANGATAADVFWQVGTSTTLGVNTIFVGSIFASVSDTVTGGSSVAGRIFAITGAVTLDTNAITESDPAVGRWEIVHTSGDNSAQIALYPGGFSTFLNADGTGYTYGSVANSICAIDVQSFNVVPTWAPLGGISYQIAITVNNLGLGPDFSFIYTGTYSAVTPVPGGTSFNIPAISGTYYATGDVSACSLATQSSPGNFVATFLPTISSGSVSGALDNFSADNGSPFDSTVSATITFSAPPANGQMAGTVDLSSNPTFTGLPCFATTSGVVNPLTINPALSSQTGIGEYIFAEGFDPNGTPTTFFLNGFSANLYAGANSDPNALQIATTEWAVAAAIGEDNPAAGIGGVSNDGTNTAMVFSYGVIGGVCNGAGGVDEPFYFLSGKHVDHKHRRHNGHGFGSRSHRDHDESSENSRKH
jgi:ice-binding like protein